MQNNIPFESFYLLMFVLGLCMGSFFTVLVDRLPHDEWPTGRSYCDYCKKTLKALYLIPVFSYLVSRGKSICCGKRLSIYYPIIELATALTYVLLWQYINVSGVFGDTVLHGILIYIIVSSFIVTLFADFKYRIIPDAMTGIFTGAALLMLLTQPTITPTLFLTHIAGATLVCGILLTIYAATKGRGMGFGDVKFAIPMGLLLGPLNGFLALYIAFILGGLYGVLALLSGQQKLKSAIPFGPFLIAGTVMMMFCGKEITTFIGQYFAGI